MRESSSGPIQSHHETWQTSYIRNGKSSALHRCQEGLELLERLWVKPIRSVRFEFNKIVFLQQVWRAVYDRRKQQSKIYSFVNSWLEHFIISSVRKWLSSGSTIAFGSQLFCHERSLLEKCTFLLVTRKSCCPPGYSVPSHWKYRPLKIKRKWYSNISREYVKFLSI